MKNSESPKKIGTKKRYAGLALQQNEEKLVFKGMESVRSDWTELSKIFQQALYKLIFNDKPVENYILQMVEDIYAGKFDDKLIYRKRLRRKLNTYIKNVPHHVKAARFADKINTDKALPLKYQNKGWIEYLITLDGVQPKEYLSAPLDYDFYIDKQIKVVADDILPFIGKSFDLIVSKQIGLF